MSEVQPSCGLYRTVADIGDIPIGRLVFFHNHGDPGPGIFLPEAWENNRASFAEGGESLNLADAARYLEPVLDQGFYRVTEPFYCCPKKCQQFETELFVQLGYDEEANPILFIPEWSGDGIRVPEEGTGVDRDVLASLLPVAIAGLEPEE